MIKYTINVSIRNILKSLCNAATSLRKPLYGLSTLILLVTLSSFTQGTDFLGMEGKRISHPFIEQADSLSAKEIIELRGEDGKTVWFGRSIRKVVCLTGECLIARLWLFWDINGDYLGFQLFDNEPLTKTNHDPFSSDDYDKLNETLSDPFSILKDIPQEELIEESELDGYSGATHLSYREQLIEGAAYTCHALWHTVYGDTRTKILRIMNSRKDEK